MTERKEVGRVEDAERILSFLQERPGGGMPYSDETEAEIIKNKFGISKGAFKRAVGKLMREGIVTQKGSWTYLAQQPNESDSSTSAVSDAEGDEQQ